jgi:hypothetical protein
MGASALVLSLIVVRFIPETARLSQENGVAVKKIWHQDESKPATGLRLGGLTNRATSSCCRENTHNTI